jgi:hypothetical protein
MRDAHQNVPMVALPGPASGGLFSDLFGGSRSQPQAQSQNTLTPNDMAPVPPASVGQPARSTNGGGSLDGWLINNLFGRRG